jgi:hypothetical protein
MQKNICAQFLQVLNLGHLAQTATDNYLKHTSESKIHNILANQ